MARVADIMVRCLCGISERDVCSGARIGSWVTFRRGRYGAPLRSAIRQTSEALLESQLPLQFRVLLTKAFREQALQTLVFVLEREQIRQFVTGS